MQKYIIMGPQGSGKGTQAKLLSQAFHLAHISMGEIFRWHLGNHTKLAARIKHCMSHGRLVPDDTVEDVLRMRLALHDWNHGFVWTGFPRTVSQARFFSKLRCRCRHPARRSRGVGDSENSRSAPLVKSAEGFQHPLQSSEGGGSM